jgi:hypothetical protein
MSSSHRKRTCDSISATMRSIWPRATKAREETTTDTCAVRQAESMPSAPVEKFKKAGTRAKACKAKKVTSAALPVGSMMPIRSPAGTRASSRRPSTTASVNRRR